MPNDEVLISDSSLRAFLVGLFCRTGLPLRDAEFSAECLVQTNLWGIDSHGVLRLPIYLERLKNGSINPTPKVSSQRGLRAFEVVDGDRGLGFVVGREAMQRAIDLARQYDIGAVGVFNSNHFGAAGLFAHMATQQDMIGLVMTNTLPNMVAPGGSRPITGNNPIALGIPTFADFPFLLDISLSNVAGGKLLLASAKKEKIPLGWATDKDGQPTDDPDKAFAGFLLPVGEHKGLGLSYAVDILAGLLTGGIFQHEIRSMYKHPDEPSLTGHFMIAINPLAIITKEEMQQRLADFIQTIKTSPMWDTSKQMMIPGEIEYKTALERHKNGIPLPGQLYEQLMELGNTFGVDDKLGRLA